MEGLTITLIIKWILISLLALSICAGFGFFSHKELYNRMDLFSVLAVGFVVFLAVLELLGWYMVAYRWSTVWFWNLVIIIVAIGMFGFLRFAQHIHTIPFLKAAGIEWKMTSLILLLQILLTFFMFRYSQDDSFYVSNSALFQVSPILNPYDSSLGTKTLGTVPMYDFQIWEALLSVCAKFFRIDAVTVCHMVIIPILLIFSACAYIFLGMTLFPEKPSSAFVFYFLLSVFHMFGGYKYSQGSFLLARIWQGKAVNLHIIMPTMTALLLKFSSGYAKGNALKLSACMLAGAALNPTSLYLLGFQMLSIVVCGGGKKQRKIKENCRLVFPSVVVLVMFALLIYYRTSQYPAQVDASSSVNAAFVVDTFIKFWKDSSGYLLIYLFTIPVIRKVGSDSANVLFVLSPLLLLIVVWNPIAGTLVAEYITKSPTFWRMYWLIPAGSAICYACTYGIQYIGQKSMKQGFAWILAIIMVAVPGSWMFTKEFGFHFAENVERLPSVVLYMGDAIEKRENQSRTIVLADTTFASRLRQKYTSIELLYSRPQYILDLLTYRKQEQEADERKLLFEYACGQVNNGSQILELMEKYNVDYIILRKEYHEARSLLKETHWTIVDETESHCLYHHVD